MLSGRRPARAGVCGGRQPARPGQPGAKGGTGAARAGAVGAHQRGAGAPARRARQLPHLLRRAAGCARAAAAPAPAPAPRLPPRSDSLQYVSALGRPAGCCTAGAHRRLQQAGRAAPRGPRVTEPWRRSGQRLAQHGRRVWHCTQGCGITRQDLGSAGRMLQRHGALAL